MAFAAFSTTYTPEPTRCSGSEKPGARALQDWACDESPWAKDLWDVGIYNCRTIAGSSTLSAHSSGRAGDSGHNIVNNASHPSGIAYAFWLIANHAVLGVQEVICNRWRWDNQSKVRKPYGGVSPHVDHVHWALNTSGATYLTRARILSVAPGVIQPPIATPEDEDDMKIIKATGRKTRILDAPYFFPVGSDSIASATKAGVKTVTITATEYDALVGQVHKALDD